MTFYDHLDIAAAVVCAVGVMLAFRKLTSVFLWTIGFAAFCAFGLLFAWSSSRNAKSAPEAKACTYRESPSALIIECAIDKKPK